MNDDVRMYIQMMMYKCTYKCMNVWMYKCTNDDVQMYECTYKCTNERMMTLTNVWMCKCTKEQMYECTNVHTNVWMIMMTNVQMYKCMNLQMYECMNVWMYWMQGDQISRRSPENCKDIDWGVHSTPMSKYWQLLNIGNYKIMETTKTDLYLWCKNDDDDNDSKMMTIMIVRLLLDLVPTTRRKCPSVDHCHPFRSWPWEEKKHFGGKSPLW